MAILDEVKADLRITVNAWNTEIASAIETAKTELYSCGVNRIDITDDKTKTAIKLYCRYWFNFQGDAERYMNAFKEMANGMADSVYYSTPPTPSEVIEPR